MSGLAALPRVASPGSVGSIARRPGSPSTAPAARILTTSSTPLRMSAGSDNGPSGIRLSMVVIRSMKALMCLSSASGVPPFGAATKTVLRTCSGESAEAATSAIARATSPPRLCETMSRSSLRSGGIMVNNSAAFCCGVTDKLGWSNARTLPPYACHRPAITSSDSPENVPWLVAKVPWTNNSARPSMPSQPWSARLPAPAVRVSPGANVRRRYGREVFSYLAARTRASRPTPFSRAGKTSTDSSLRPISATRPRLSASPSIGAEATSRGH